MLVADTALEAKKEQARRELARRYLFDFFQQGWRVLEPQTPLYLNWHQELICEYLMQVSGGQIKYLLINVAPRSLKSKIISVFFPCWEWLKYPSLHYLCMSYSSSLANDHNDERRALIQSSWYQALSGGMRLSNTKNRITEFKNDKQGQMVARGLEGSVTGGGGNRLIFDDPNNPDQVESDSVRKSTLTKFKDYSIGRRNDPKNTAVVVVQQRTHTEDVSGYILKDLSKYVHVCLPTEAEEQQRVVFPLSSKYVDRAPGGLLHPERFGPEEVEEAKTTLGSYMYAGRHQQRPVPREGGMIQLKWFRRYAVPPTNYIQIIQSWDTAAKAKELNAPWVCGTWLEFDSNFYLLDVFRKQMLYPDGKRMAKSLAQKYQPNVILIEDKSTGQALIPELKDNPEFGYSIIAVEPCGDKETRMSTESAAIEAGRVLLPYSAPWLVDFEQEAGTFPLSATMDQVDMMSQFLRYMRERSAGNWLSVYSMR